MSVVETFLFLYPISITADIIVVVINGGGFVDIRSDLIFLFFFAIFQATIFFTINFVNEILAHRITTDMTYELYESLQYKSLAYHDKQDIGQIMSRATGDTRIINNALSPGIVRSLSLLTTWVIALFLTLQINPILALFTIISFLIYIISVYRFGQGMLKLSTDVLVNFALLSENSMNTISGIREIKGFVAVPWTNELMGSTIDKHIQSRIKEGEKGSWFYPALIATFYSIGIISLSIYFAFNGYISFREVILVAGIISFLRVISSEFSWVSRMIISAIAATQRVYGLITDADDSPVEEGTLEFTGKSTFIEFINVSFRYNPDLPQILKNISFKVDEKQTIAIVGSPGSGKSTLTKLIQRLYIPTKGEILIGNIPLNSYTNTSLRKVLATVEQDIFLFNDSILENIRFGKPDASEDEVIEVAKLAEAHDFIISFPNKYHNLVGEGGIKLSGGQAQRIAIARALLVDPAILLMDDGASALDAQTETKIQSAITEILKTRTTIITTHRLAIIAKADLVIILKKGEIVGIGTHEELICSNVNYRQLFERHYELPPLVVGD